MYDAVGVVDAVVVRSILEGIESRHEDRLGYVAYVEEAS